MTPDELDAILDRVPSPEPPAQLRERVLSEMERRMTRRGPGRRVVRGGFALAVAIAAFAAIVWIILPGTGKKQTPATRSTLQVAWETETNRPQVNRLTVIGNRLYAETPDAAVIAIDRLTGQTTWTFRVEAGTPLDWPPVSADRVPQDILSVRDYLAALERQLAAEPSLEERPTLLQKRENARERLRWLEGADNVYLVSRQVLYAVGRKDGELRWSRILSFVPTGRPSANPNEIYVPEGRAGKVWALSVESQGEQVAFSWTRGFRSGGAMPVANGPVWSDPYLYYLDEAGALLCFDPRKDHEVYGHPGGPGKVGELSVHIGRAPAVGGQPRRIRLALWSTGSILRAVDADAGTLAWEYDCGSAVRGIPIVREDTVFAATEDGTVHALEFFPTLPDGSRTLTGRLRWKASAKSFLASGKNGAYLLEADGNLSLRGTGGQLLGVQPLERLDLFVPNGADGDLYAVRPGGRVICLRERE